MTFFFLVNFIDAHTIITALHPPWSHIGRRVGVGRDEAARGGWERATLQGREV